MRFRNQINIEIDDTLLANKLYEAVRDNDCDTIKKCINQNPSLLTHKYPSLHNQTILLIACNDQNSMHNVKKNTIKTLVKLGAKSNDCWEPIHHIAINCNKEKLETILELLNEKEANCLVTCSSKHLQRYPLCPNKIPETYSNNALNLLLKYGNHNEQLYDCCKLLIDKGLNVYQSDSNGVSPADILQGNEEERMRLLPGDIRTNEDNFFQLVNENNIDGFISKIKFEHANGLDGKEEHLSSCTLLQVCCLKGLTNCVEKLLKKRSDPNRGILRNPKSPIRIAIENDHEEIVEMLLSNSNLVLANDVLLKLEEMHSDLVTLSNKYMKILINHIQLRIPDKIQDFLTAKDANQRTVLHHSVYHKSNETSLQLLNMGASLMAKDVFNHSPIDAIEPHVLETFFNQSITSKPNGTISITYKSLQPEEEQYYNFESEFIQHLYKNQHLNFLMVHPLVASLLCLKWEKFKWPVYINITLYLIAYVSLLWDGLQFTNAVRESNFFLYLTTILIVSREVILMFIFGFGYVKQEENILAVPLIGGLSYIIASYWLDFSENHNTLMCYSIVSLTATLGIFYELSNFPLFSIKVVMLKEVAKNFLKYMAFYIFPILAFVLCFYMLREKTDDSSFLQTFYLSVIMYSGNADSEFPTKFTTNPIFSHLIFVLFIILICIILNNLLIGLAVSDLQAVQNETKFICKKRQAKYIVKFEHTILKQFQLSSFTRKFFENLLSVVKVFENKDYLEVRLNKSSGFYIENKLIWDEDLLGFLKESVRNLLVEDPYSLRSLHKKIEKLENAVSALAEKLDTRRPLKQKL